MTVGEHAKEIGRWPALRDLLPLEVAGQPRVRAGSGCTGVPANRARPACSAGARGEGGQVPGCEPVPETRPPARVLIPPPDRRGEKDDIIAGQSAFGLGRVTVIGFDLDRSPFAEFPQRPEFWDWVLREGGANRASAGSDGKPRPGAAALTEEEDELAVALRTHVDTFEGVPVVSFGWVALLIVLYILLIGPIEYFFLKRVLGRLELTWITFPIIVLTVSLAAYFTAYSLKGRDLKVNKIDVVDVDLAGRARRTARPCSRSSARGSTTTRSA